MGNISSILVSHSNDVENEKIYKKIVEAVDKKHLKIPNLTLTKVPRIITSEELKEELNEPLKSFDIHSNPLQHFPMIELPNLTTLNLWGNNMSCEMFAPHPAPAPKQRISIQDKILPRARRFSSPKVLSPVSEIDRQEYIENGAFSALPKLDCLDIGCNQLTQVPLSIQKCTKLSQVTLSGNFLISVENEVLEPLVDLNLLDLDLNNLTEIPPACLKGKEKLFSLAMRGNQVERIPEGLKELISLQTLNLADNELQVVESGAFSTLSRLKNLYLFQNILSTLPADFFGSLSNLTNLFLQGNQLKHLPPLDGLNSLRVLNVSYNVLTRLPVMKAMESLTQLDVSHNRLLTLPSSIQYAAELRTIDASYNELSQLPISFSALSHLSTLNLTGNSFNTGGRNILDVVPGTPLEDSGPTEGLQPIWSLKALQTLHLSLNNISSLPSNAFQNLTTLKTLNLGFNNIATEGIPLFLSSDPEVPLVIENLFLNCNIIDEFPTQLLVLHKTLSGLALEGNSIRKLPADFSKFSVLSRFSLSAPYQKTKSKKRKKNSAPSFGPLKDIKTLTRLYVGSYFRGTLEDLSMGTEDESDCKDMFTELQYTDLSCFPAFPSFSCSPEKMGRLKSRPYGASLCTGTSHDLEDCVNFRTFSLPGCEDIDYIALFDGHGGSEVALFIQQHLAPVVESFLRQSIEQDKLKFADTPENSNLVGKAIIKAYIDTNKSLEFSMKSSNLFDKHVGSTCITLIITEEMLYCANVGDSRAVLGTFALPLGDTPKVKRSSSQSLPSVTPPKVDSRTLFSTRLSFDHKPNVRKERERIRHNGGVLVQSLSGTCSYRLTQPCGGPTLAVSRSFGDFHLRPSMSVEPDVFCRPLESADQFIVVSSDGLWDVLSDKMCVDIVAELLYQLNVEQEIPIKTACEIAASHVRDLVFSLGSNDDLSVVIVPLNWNQFDCMEEYFCVNSSPPPECAEFPKQPKKKKRKKEKTN